MKDAGINVVRIAESTWSTLEPQDGVFDFTHVDRVLDAMHRASIRVIVGTPTYAVPDVARAQVPGRARRHAAGTEPVRPAAEHGHHQPALPVHAERVIRRLLEHVKDHPAIIGYQVDNETKHYQTAGPAVQALFVQYMKEQVRDAGRGQPRLRPRLLEQPHRQLGGLPVHRRQHQREPQRRVREVPAPAGDRLPGVAGGHRQGVPRGRASSSRRTSTSSGAGTRTGSSRTWITSRPRGRWTWPASTSTTRRRTR